MSKMLLINPRRRKSRKARSPAQKAATLRMLAANRARKSPARRRRNPISRSAVRTVMKRRARRSNPVATITSRRRRNPISLGGVNVKSIMSAVKDAAIGAGGAIGMDALMAKVSPMLPPSLQLTPGSVGAGDAVKALLTILAGKLLAKPTKGLSVKMAQGSLTVQAHGILSQFVPAGLGLGFYSPATIVNGSQRVGPNRQLTRGNMNAYIAPGSTPLLSGKRVGAYMTPGASPLLSGNTDARRRENVTQYR